MSISDISKLLGLNYSNLRRLIKEEVANRNLEPSFNVQYFNCEDFDFLKIGDTYQFADWMTIWQVRRVVIREGQRCFELVSTKHKGRRHFIGDEEAPPS